MFMARRSEHMVTLELPCATRGMLVALAQYHERTMTGRTPVDLLSEAIARGLQQMVVDSRDGLRRCAEPLNPHDINVQ